MTLLFCIAFGIIKTVKRDTQKEAKEDKTMLLRMNDLEIDVPSLEVAYGYLKDRGLWLTRCRLGEDKTLSKCERFAKYLPMGFIAFMEDELENEYSVSLHERKFIDVEKLV